MASMNSSREHVLEAGYSPVNIRSVFDRVFQQEHVNFVLTNSLPRRLLTRFMGWFSQIEQPLVRDASLALWQRFADLQLHEAKHTDFRSLHECFIRELKPGARTIDPDPASLVSPCDAIVGAAGRIQDTTLIQAKGLTYTLEELLLDPELVRVHRGGSYATLRLTASMYHRFHAPYDCSVERVRYVSGDTWNTNPSTVGRVDKLFCKNERAVLRTRLQPGGQVVTLVPVAAILVASIRLHCLDVLLHLQHRGPNVFDCDASYRKGDEMGWFQHGSTILVFAPPGVELCESIQSGARIQQGQALMRLAT
jgi:phosphatidylserine decarboxylase